MLFDPVPELNVQHWKIADNDRRLILLDLNGNRPGSLANDFQIAHHGIYGATVCSIHGAT